MYFTTFLLILFFSPSAFSQWKTDNNSLIRKNGQFQFYSPQPQEVETQYDQHGAGSPYFETFLLTPDCVQKNLQNFGARFDNNLSNLTAPIENLHCLAVGDLEKNQHFNESVCNSLAACLKMKLTNNPLINLGIIQKARENTAAEAIALISKNRIDEMMKFEELRLFAEKKYGKDFLPESCKDIKTFQLKKDSVGAKCNSKIIDIGFDIGVSNCKSAHTGCNPDFSEYMKKVNTSNDKSHMGTFFEKKSEKNLSAILKQEDVFSEKIAAIIVDEKHTPEDKVEQMFNLFEANYTMINPVYKDFYNSFKHDPVRKESLKKGIAKYIISNSSKTKTEMIFLFEDLKKSEAKSMLIDKCNKIEANDLTTLNGLCTQVDNILNGGDVEIDDMEFSRFQTQYIVKNEKHGDSIWDLAKNVSRCSSFTLVTSNKTSGMKLKNKLSEYDLLSDLYGSSNVKSRKSDKLHQFIKRPTLVISASGEPTIRDENFLKGPLTTSVREKTRESILETQFTKNLAMTESYKSPNASETSNMAFGVKEGSIKVEAVKDFPVQNQAQQAIQSAQITKGKDSAQTHSFNQLQKPNVFIPKNNDDHATEQERVAPNETSKVNIEQNDKTKAYSALVNKIQTLEGRLAAASKEDKKTAVTESSALVEGSRLGKEIKSFKDELEELKKANDKESESGSQNPKRSMKVAQAISAMKSLPAEADDESSDADSDATESSKSFAGAVAAPVTISSASAVSSSQSSGADSQSRSERSASGKNSTANSVESISSSDVQILTSASNDGSDESIAELINSGADQPFFIEFEGVIQQIIPELINGKVALGVDGKPVYKKIAKGKAAEFNVKSNSKIKRSIAKANSPADVKKMDEAQDRDKVRYQQMKESLILK